MARNWSPGRTRAPKGNNELMNPPDPIQTGQWDDFPNVYAQNQRDSFGQGGKISTKNRHSRPCSGPSYSSAKDLEYKGT